MIDLRSEPSVTLDVLVAAARDACVHTGETAIDVVLTPEQREDVYCQLQWQSPWGNRPPAGSETTWYGMRLVCEEDQVAA